MAKVIARTKGVRGSAQKFRLVADLIRGQSVEKALDILTFSSKRAAFVIKKTLESAIANAENNEGIDIDSLVVDEIYIDKAKSLRRFMARAKGRGNHIEKQTCHINIIVAG